MDIQQVPADLQKAFRRLGGSVDLLREVAQIYIEDHGHIAAELRKAVQRGDATATERAAHSLKGLSSNFDREQLIERCDRLEKIARAGDLTEAGQLLADIHRETVTLSASLQDFVGSKSSGD